MGVEKVDDHLVFAMAKLAGFSFSEERCKLLVPQLEWMAKEAEKVDVFDRSGMQPVIIFTPNTWVTGESGGED